MPAVDARRHAALGVSVLHGHPLLAAGILAMLADPAVDDAPLALAAAVGQPVLVTDYQQAMRQPHDVPVLVVEGGLTVYKVRSLLQVGTQGCISAEGSAGELLRAVAALRSGGNYFCPTVTGLLADAVMPAVLTRGEQRVLELLCQGLDNKTIAGHLQIAVGTVKTHVKAMLAKTETRTRTALVARSIRCGWVTAEAALQVRPIMPPPRCRLPTATLR